MPTVPAGAKEAAKNRLKRLLGMADQQPAKAAELPAVEPFPKPIESQSVSPVTATQRAAITTPAEGLLIYNTTTQRLNIYNTSWIAVH